MSAVTELTGSAGIQQKRMNAKRKLAKQKLMNGSQSYGTLSGSGSGETIMFQNGTSSVAPMGVAKQFSDIQNDNVFDTPASTLEETGAQFEKQAAYIALIAASYDLVDDDNLNEFIADRSKALASAQRRQPEYMKQFVKQWEDAEGFFEGAGVILSSPRAIGRQIVTQGANSSIPLLATAAGATAGSGIGGALGGAAGSVVPIAGTAVGATVGAGVGAVAGGTAGAFVGGSIVEVGAEIDGMLGEKGFDMSKKEDVLKALGDKDLMAEIKAKALRKGMTTASVDAVFQLVGGRFLKMAKGVGAGAVKKAGAATADVAVQSVGEGVGELAGQFAKDGKVNIKDGVLEAITGLGQSVGQTAIGASFGGVKKTAQVARDFADKSSSKISEANLEGDVTEADANAAVAEMDVAEAQMEAAVEQSRTVEAEQVAKAVKVEEAEIMAEANEIKAGIKEAQDVKPTKPETFEKALGAKPESLHEFSENLGAVIDENGRIENGKIDILKQFAFNAGYFPDRKSSRDITDEDFFAALKESMGGNPRFSEVDLAKMRDVTRSLEGERSALRLRGILRKSTVEEIAAVLKEERAETARKKAEKGQAAPPSPLFLDDVQTIKENEKGLFGGKMLPKFLTDFGKGLERALTPISTRIKNINHKLFVRIRRFEFDVKTNVIADNEALAPFLEKLGKLDEDTQIAFDIAMKNGDVALMNFYAQENNMVEELQQVRDLLDAIFKRAEDVGMSVNYRSDFFPRNVNDYEGLMKLLRGVDDWNVIEQEISKRESQTGPMTEVEKISAINDFLRGIEGENFELTQLGVFKERKLESISPAMDEFYDKTDQSLLSYIRTVNQSIQLSKLFGKGMDIDGTSNIEESLGDFIKGMSDRGEITTDQVETLKEILTARFNEGRMGWITGAARNLSYIDTMGNVFSAITQFGDLATAAYNSGLFRAASELPRAIAGKGPIDLHEIGIDAISEEFVHATMTSKAVNTVFKFSGLSKIDRVGKLTLVNSAVSAAQRKAKKNDKAFLAELDAMFDSNAPRALEAFKSGEITDDVKFYAFNTLLDFQPMAQSEMPQYYLSSGNLKIMYMLKTFTIRQLDIYRREVFSGLTKAARTGDVKLAAKSMKNFVRLAGFWIVMGSTADWMKDYIKSMFGDSEIEEPEDYVVDNILKAFGFSRYQLNMVGKSGPAEVVTQMFIPPRKFLNNVAKDFRTFNKDGLTLENSKSIRSIPLAGELYYFWFGAGSGDGSTSNKFLTK